MSEERRTVKTSAMLTPSENAVLVALAREEGRTKSQIIARLLVKEAIEKGMWEASDD